MSLLDIFKKKENLLGEKLFEEEKFDIRDIVAPPFIGIDPTHIKLGERLARSFFVFSYPRYLNTGWFSPVIDLNTPLDISFFIHPVSNELILKKLRKKITEVSSELLDREERGLVRDPALETAYKDIENLRDKLMTSQEKMFRFGLYITIYENTEKELKDTELTLRSIFESRLIYIKPALFRQKEGFISCSPYGLDLLGVSTPMDTEPLSTAFPFISFDLSSNEGILYGINRHNNSLVLFDRFGLENANLVCFAKAGSGKSQKGEEPVLIKNKHRVQLIKIGSLVEKLIKKRGLTKIDEELEGVVNPDIKVYSFDKNLKGSWSKVTVAARKKAPDIFYKFKTKSGREITTTGDHNMLILKNGTVVAEKSSEINEGEFIPLPREIFQSPHLPSQCISFKGLPIENYKLTFSQKGKYKTYLPLNDDFLKLVGLITAEGTITKNYIEISNTEKEILDEIRFALKRLNICFYETYNKGKIDGVRTINKEFVEMIIMLGGKGKSKQKKVYPFIFNLKKEKVAKYLSAYFEGDGGVERHRLIITATSKSKDLISEVAYLLYYFGIIGRIAKTKKWPTNQNWKRKKTYWKLSISGQDNLRKFAENINFISSRKKKDLSEIIKKDGNTNVDLIPGLESIFKEIYNLFGYQLSGIPEISEWKRGVRHPSPEHLKKVIGKIEEKISYFKNLSSTFSVLSNLPLLPEIVNAGKDKETNKRLWHALGHSWQTMRSGKFIPGSINVFKAVKIASGNDYSLTKVKEKIHSGFLEMNLPIKYYNHSLSTALIERKESDTSYPMIKKSADFIWQNYQNILTNNIPRVEQLLNQLKGLANSDLFWDPIVKIKKIKNIKDKYVYDLTVDNEVFLAGTGGMFVHNSYAIKLEVLRYLMQGVMTIIVDPENEYEFLADAVGGAFFKISLTSPHHVNPFDLPVPGPDDNPEDILRSNIINLVGLLRIMLGGLSPEEDSIIDEALTETYAVRDITPHSDPKTWQNNIPLLSDFTEVLESMEGAESLVRRLKKFNKGTFADFFNQHSNISMDKDFVVFGIRDMEESLKPMALYIIMRYVWSAIRTTLRKRILVVDEAWWLMQTDDGASFLYGIAKRGRKYWLGVTTITQDVEDFMKSDYGKAIISNSSIQFLLKQSSATIDTVQHTFNLTEQEKFLLLEAAVGEGLFFAGKKHVALSVVASYTEDQIITTAPDEVLRIREARKKLIK